MAPEASAAPDERVYLIHLSLLLHVLAVIGAHRVRRALREGDEAGTSRLTAICGLFLVLGIIAYWVLAAFHPVFFAAGY